MSTVVTVHHLGCDEEQTFVGITPEQAVVAAHEQSRGNWNTESYAALLPRVQKGKVSVSLGDFAARRNPDTEAPIGS